MKLTKRDLIVLRHCSSNPCYLEVVLPRQIEGLDIDLETGTFNYQENKGIRIGQEANLRGVLGVYNRRNLKHLNSMVHQATEAVRDMSGSDW